MTGAQGARPAPLARGDDAVTRVDLVHEPGVLEHWIRFGRTCAETILDRRRRSLWFRPGSIFGFVRWRANAFGTVRSAIDIAVAALPDAATTRVPGITPGIVSLLQLDGWPKVARVLAAIDAVEALGLDPADACPDHWRHVHHHLSAGSAPRPYSLARHRAWTQRAAISC